MGAELVESEGEGVGRKPNRRPKQGKEMVGETDRTEGGT